MSTIEFRRLTLEDGPQFSAFLGHCFGNGFFSRPELYKYWHFDNPAGKSIIYGAFDGDKLVGTNALQKSNLWIHGQKLLAAHSFSSATHPDYRLELIKHDGKIETIYTRLNTLCRQQAIKENCRLTYGFPNEKAIIPTIKFAGYKNIGSLKIFINIFRLAEILTMKRPAYSKIFCHGITFLPQLIVSARSFFKQKPKGNIQIQMVRQIDNELDQLMNDNVAYYPIIQDRNSAFIQWRFNNFPVLPYCLLTARKHGQLLGYLVYVIYPWPEREEHRILCGYIVDFLVRPDNEGDTALYHLLYHARQHFQKQKTVISTSIHHIPDRYNKIFNQAGYFVAQKKIIPRLIHFLIRQESVSNDNISSQSVNSLGNWYLTLADNDII
ncbi:MAG: GNAT family N-acetyltransferase [Planctomycetaceae bacterium]|jgi:hypothetical protein|nr:GNAT family N-acetyltransferase [Planctomycetaceae bacterium]